MNPAIEIAKRKGNGDVPGRGRRVRPEKTSNEGGSIRLGLEEGEEASAPRGEVPLLQCDAAIGTTEGLGIDLAATEGEEEGKGRGGRGEEERRKGVSDGAGPPNRPAATMDCGSSVRPLRCRSLSLSLSRNPRYPTRCGICRERIAYMWSVVVGWKGAGGGERFHRGLLLFRVGRRPVGTAQRFGFFHFYFFYVFFGVSIWRHSPSPSYSCLAYRPASEGTRAVPKTVG